MGCIAFFEVVVSELERTGGCYGLQTRCEGYGMVNAIFIG